MANIPVARLDGTNQRLDIFVQDATTGNVPPQFARVIAALGDLGVYGDALVPGSGQAVVAGHGRLAQFRWLYFKDAKNGCAPMKMLVLCTLPEADA